MTKLWLQISIDQAQADSLVDGLGVTPIVARLLVARGITEPDEARRFLRPRLEDCRDPFSLPGVKEAVDMLAVAIAEQERICVYGDYDADGVTATCLLTEVIRELGGDVHPFVPERSADGYGIGEKQVRRLAAEGFSTIVTVDNGITAHKAAEAAATLGLRLIITDHHALPETLPGADVLVNPHLLSGAGDELAGVGVAFKLAQALCLTQGKSAIPMRHLDLVAVGTVADMVPMLGDNRVLVAAGLRVVNEGSRIGLRALKRACGAEGELTAEDLGFLIAPRLNAAGRMGSAGEALRLLMTSDNEEASRLAETLDGYNHRRRSVEQMIIKEAVETVEAEDWTEQPAIVLASSGWHEGVIGVACAKIAERFHRPTFLLAVRDGVAKGSGRSAGRVNIHRALNQCGDIITSGGGHSMAAGVTVEASKIDEFRQRFRAAVLAQASLDEMLPELKIDTAISLSDVTESFYDDICSLAPFGPGNPVPVFMAEKVYLEATQKLGGGDHVRFLACQDDGTLEAVAFAVRDLQRILDHSQTTDLAFQVGRRQWRGASYLQAKLVDLKLHDDPCGSGDGGFATALAKPMEELSRAIREGSRSARPRWEPGTAPIRVESLRIIDERLRPDKDLFVVKLVARGQPTAIYVNDEQAAVEVTETINLKSGGTRACFLVEGMSPKLLAMVESAFASGQITTIVTASPQLLPDKCHIRNLILYHPTLGVDMFVLALSKLATDSSLGFVYVLFDPRDVAAAGKLISKVCPSRRTMIEFYRYLSGAGSVEEWPRDQGHPDVLVRVLVELGLLESASDTRLLPVSVGTKMDLLASPTFSAACRRREAFDEFRDMISLPVREWLKWAGRSSASSLSKAL